jgi:hypothetical protein
VDKKERSPVDKNVTQSRRFAEKPNVSKLWVGGCVENEKG